MTKCAIPACPEDNAGRHQPFCVGHYFKLPKPYTSLVTRTSIECSRIEDPDKQQHLRDQLAGYIASCIRQLEIVADAEGLV
ncbi:hypothetical protein, partial [Mesorhizobium sp. B4-1-1]|uniref:hypothetical protein n=1 Tax=Mesorhizobium sp. B4-1-1 TaxID=2589890 RepID=UPI00112DFD69